MKIYFDMDGVIADFNKGIKELCGLEPMAQGDRDEERTTQMWSAVKAVPHFYLKLDPIPEGMELFSVLYDLRPDDVEILTAQPKPKRNIETAELDKRLWCEQYLPMIPVNVSYRSEKQNYANGNILIDDFDENIEEWESQGGTGILFTNKDEVLEKLKELNII